MFLRVGWPEISHCDRTYSTRRKLDRQRDDLGRRAGSGADGTSRQEHVLPAWIASQ